MADNDSQAQGESMAFGRFCVHPAKRLLTRDGEPVEIGGRSFDLLMALAEQPGRVLSKRELLKRVWPDVVVEDGSLRFHMAGLRKLLGEGAGSGKDTDGPRFIATQVGVGYAFVAPVQRIGAPASEAAMPALETPTGFATNIPPALPHLVGREQDVELLLARVVDTPLFTIAGPAGVGKTSLLIEIGHRLTAHFGGRVAFVDFAMLENPALVPPMIAGAMGLSVPGGDPAAVILGQLRTGPFLLLLDNCEHVIDEAAGIVERITQAAPQVRIVTTSREPLRVRGEHVHRLEALACPPQVDGVPHDEILAYPAVQLFCERARAADSTLQIDEGDARLIADMCQRLDGMALPIELAAVRVATHGIAATARQIGERFSLAWSGHRTAQPRQQTLRGALDWSYDLLSPTERTVLDRLAVFVGPFSIDAALEVVTDAALGSDEAAMALDELVAKSLVAPSRTRGAGTYRLLEMTRAYARDKLAMRGNGEQRIAALHHARFFLSELEGAAAQDDGGLRDMQAIRPQLGNIRSALDWSFGPDGDIGLAVRLTSASMRVFLGLSHLVECRNWAARALAVLPPEQRGTTLELELQAALGITLMFAHANSVEAGEALTRALDVAAMLEDRWSQLITLARLHIFREHVGDCASAEVHAEQAIVIAAQIGAPDAMAIACSLSGISRYLAGDQVQARRDLERALEQSAPSQQRGTSASGFDHRNRASIALARVLWLAGEPDAALRLAERTLAEAAALNLPVTHCIALICSLSIQLWMGDLARAEATLAILRDCAQTNALAPYILVARCFDGELALEHGDHAGAVYALDHNLPLLRATRYELLTTRFSIALARGLAGSGRQDAARRVIEDTMTRCESIGERVALAELLRVRAASATPDEARRLLEEAAEIARQQGAYGWERRIAADLARLPVDVVNPVPGAATTR